jgi:four helix bundle protein
MERKNINRGYRKLNVWNDAIELYCSTCCLMANLPFELKRSASNSIDAAQSISRNIAEGYCRRSIKEYIQYLYFALGSSGELHSCMCSYYRAGQISEKDFVTIDQLHYKTENELIRLVKSLHEKMKGNDWNDRLIL